MMTKRLIATVAAAALALTAFATTPVRAGTSDFEKFIMATTAMIAIGAAVNSSKRQKMTPVVTRYPGRPPQTVYVPSHCVKGYGQNRWVDWNCTAAYGY